MRQLRKPQSVCYLFAVYRSALPRFCLSEIGKVCKTWCVDRFFGGERMPVTHLVQRGVAGMDWINSCVSCALQPTQPFHSLCRRFFRHRCNSFFAPACDPKILQYRSSGRYLCKLPYLHLEGCIAYAQCPSVGNRKRREGFSSFVSRVCRVGNRERDASASDVFRGVVRLGDHWVDFVFVAFVETDRRNAAVLQADTRRNSSRRGRVVVLRFDGWDFDGVL